MRFPSLALLAERAADVARRFPFTLIAGGIAATAAIIATDSSASTEDEWVRRSFVAALGLPITIALRLVAERRRWSPSLKLFAPALGLAALAGFYAVWPGPEQKHHVIRYLQLSATAHLAVAFLPLLGARGSLGFWQYNRRLFLGFLRAYVFSGVLFVGIIIALAALDQLFGVDIDEETYVRIWFFMAFVVNTWIFLDEVPEDLDALEGDTEYPRPLKVFAQYILTPLVFAYLLILLAYLVKIVAGTEWPSGWIGWLVTSVAVTGLLGFLLVHPLRADPAEAWIRTYARWLFVGLIPAAIMLLVAFWKRIEPYGLTEPRVLGVLLGTWLLGIAIRFTFRPDTGIQLIPSSLAALLLLTLYGPLGVTRVSVANQRNRLREHLATAESSREDAAQASAALRFLMEHEASSTIASAIGKELPAIDWQSARQRGAVRDSIGATIMALAGARYVPEYATPSPDGTFFLGADRTPPMQVTGFDWILTLHSSDSHLNPAVGDTIAVHFDTTTGSTQVQVGADTVRFELQPVVERYVDSMPVGRAIRAELLQTDAAPGGRKARLMLESLSGGRVEGSLRIRHWSATLLIGRRET